MSKKSFFYIFFLLAMPVFIVLFLHFFGDNRFDVQIYHQDFSKGVYPSCLDSSMFPYKVSRKNIPFELKEDHLSLIHLPLIPDYNRLQWIRLCEKLDTEKLNIVILYNKMEPEITCGDLNQMAQEELMKLAKCQFILPDKIDLVLMDGKGNIRGYYNSLEREEIDRLAIEVDILLENNEYGSH